MADPKVELNPVTVGFIDTSPTVSQRVPVTAANPLPVTLASGATDQDVNVAAIGGTAIAAGQPLPITAAVSTVSTTITRPSDTTAYAANDAFANSTSAPTAGGFTLTGMARASGGSGTITDAVFSMSGGTALQGEIWLFDQAVTAVNDNAAFTVSDVDILNLVGVIPFNCTDVTAANSVSYVLGIGLGFTCVGSANLRFLVKVMNAPTPASAEVLSVRLHVQN